LLHESTIVDNKPLAFENRSKAVVGIGALDDFEVSDQANGP